MRILFVEFIGALGGGERSLLELAHGLRDDHELGLACPPGPLADRARDLGLRVHPIPASQLTFRLHPRHTPRGLADMAHAMGRLGWIVRRVRPDLVHANSIRAGLLAIPAGRGVAPVVVHCRDTVPRGLAGSAVRHVVLTGAAHVVAISRHVATKFAGPGWDGYRMSVVHNAVDLTRFDPASMPRASARRALAVDDGRLVLSVIAQITPWKGQDLAIRTVAELVRRGSNAILLVVGAAKFIAPSTRHDNRAFEQELHALVRSLGLDNRVRFLGEWSSAEQIISATDVVLVPSHDEPFGRTIIEAMSMGVPVAATSVGGPRELLSDGVGGQIVRGRDAADWADAVEDLANRPAEQRAAARAAATARFARERHAVAMLAVYEAALSAAATPLPGSFAVAMRARGAVRR